MPANNLSIRERAARQGVWWILRFYQLTLSFWLGRRCRFHPTCSHYAQEAVMRHGVVRGVGLALKRVAKCGPWGGSGFDPVPEMCDHTHHTKR
jgi:putative membrane protein insertion efficiency factor